MSKPITAISCVGRTRLYSLELDSSEREGTRVYILDDDRRAVLLYRADAEGFLNACDRGEGCRLAYGSVLVTYSQSAPNYRALRIDRMAATVTEIEGIAGSGPKIFDWRCGKIDMPTPRTNARF